MPEGLLYQADTFIMPTLVALKKCVCEELERSGLAEGCGCALQHGSPGPANIPAVGKGYAWVGIQNAFPSKAFPQPEISDGSCLAPLAATIQVGLIRCYPIQQSGDSEENMLKYLDKQMADMAALRRALVCCSNDFYVSLGSYTSVGPEGGVYGGMWLATVGQSNA